MGAPDYGEQGTALAGYETRGPYHCEDCVHKTGDLCMHPVVMADPALKSQRKKNGYVQVDLEHGCCSFVKQDEPKHPLEKVIGRLKS